MTLTKSWLQKQITDLEDTRDEITFGMDEDGNNTLAALKMALAVMEAEPVFKINHDSSLIKHVKKVVRETSAPQPLNTSDRADLENYRNAQQVVPEWTNEQCLEFLSIAFRHAEIKGDLEMDDIRLGVKMVNACRAAMLQAGNSPVTPDGWQLVPKEPTEAMNKAGWAAMNEHDAINPTYRAMLAAAPQQEVKSALEHGMQRYAGAMQKLADAGD
ncbi:hypothetical protein ACTNF7_000841 [Citrobacter braakii]